jgi:hypothetical protein
MNQVLNIFRKDVRHLWIEIAASLALTIGFVWFDLREWSESRAMAYGAGAVAYGLLSGLVVPLLPISWMLLIVRAVHSESLVGDRQFWVTRPYDWKKLLAAKLLFILTFIILPLFLADVFLLAKAGFSPLSYLGALLWLQLFWTLFLLLPTAALATVTRNIGHMLLALLFILLFGIGMGIISSAIPNSGYASTTANACLFFVAAAVVAVILLQYSRRKTNLSRRLLFSLGAIIALILIAAPYRTLIAHDFPLAVGSNAPLQLTLLPSRPPDEAAKIGNSVIVHLPFTYSGMPKDSFVMLKGRMLTLTNAQGAHWDSGWQASGLSVFPDQNSLNTDFYMPKEDFDRMKSSPVQAHLLLAFTLFRDHDQKQMIVPSGEFYVPDFGFCTAQSIAWSPLTCRIPLHTAEYLLISVEEAKTTCPPGNNELPPDPGSVGRQLLEGERPVEPGLTPVQITRVTLSDGSSSSGANRGICPGTPITLSTPEETGHSRIELQFDNFSLTAYQSGSHR